MSYNTLKLELDGAVGRLILNRPDRANAMTMEMGRELSAAMQAVRASNVRALIVTGAGKHFCAGADMAEFERLQAAPPDQVQAAVRVFLDAIGQLHHLPLPVIARINGDAFGGGTGLALAAGGTRARDGDFADGTNVQRDRGAARRFNLSRCRAQRTRPRDG
ncbi:MAG: hypothetical protein DCC52_11540 [Chloroflexi bacterium]|nr:MAG: hypothetical protein DCC52_11540 [Chloroflexota bacterium]